MTDTHIAKLMWDAYVVRAGGKTFDGKPLPTWDDLGGERQSCWIAAASVTADRIAELEEEVRQYSEDMAAVWKNDGKCLWSASSFGEPSQSLDLIEVPPRHKRTVWMNVYGSGIVPEVWSAKENADRAAACGRIACIKVELDFEEGEGL
jgi:hypothetical protein